MLVVKKIVEDKFQNLFDFLLDIYESYGFIHDLKFFSENSRRDSNNGHCLNPNDETKLIKDMFVNISKVMTSQNVPKEYYAGLVTEKHML